MLASAVMLWENAKRMASNASRGKMNNRNDHLAAQKRRLELAAPQLLFLEISLASGCKTLAHSRDFVFLTDVRSLCETDNGGQKPAYSDMNK